MTGELIKYGGRRLHTEIIKVVKRIWNNEILPEEWEVGIFIPLHKKGPRTECKNFRGLCILTIGYKIFVKVLYARLLPYYLEVVGEYQAGFCPSKSTIDNIFALRQISEKYWEYDKDTWHIFVDFKQAYDSVHRRSMWNILRSFRVPEKLIRLITACYRNTKGRVRIGGELTDLFEVRTGLKQ